MCNWSNLPNEILQDIFKRLDCRDLLHCSLTCRGWRSTAQRVLFESIPPLNDQQLIDLANTLSNLDTQQSPGNCVKILNCTKLTNDFDMALLDKVFPHLEIIDINTQQQTLYEQLYTLIMEGKFINLKKLPYAKWNKEHLDLVLARKDDIKELELRSSYMYAPLEKLDLFTNLETLKLYCFNIEKTVFIETLLSKHIPTLKYIDFTFEIPFKITFNASPRYSREIQAFPNLKEVKITHHDKLLFGGEKTYQYIMQKFPNVDVLDIKSTSSKPLQTPYYDLPSVESLTDFLIYLFNIKQKSTVPPIITDQHTNEVISNLFNYVQNQRSNRKSIDIELKIGFHNVKKDEARDYPAERISYIKPHNTHHSNKSSCQIEVVYKVLPGKRSKPYLQLFERMGSVDIDKLSIGEVGDKKAVRVELETVFDYFTNLKKLKLCRSTFYESNLSLQTQSKHLSSLEFFNCMISQEIFPKLSKKFPKLKTLDLNFTQFIHYTAQSQKTANRIIFIDMPTSRLNVLSFYISLRDNYSDGKFKAAFIRLRTETKKPRYCKIIQKSQPRNETTTEFDTYEGSYTDDDYRACLGDQKCMVYDIYCKSVKKMTVKVNSALYGEDPIYGEKNYTEKGY